jgi:hypothetical protein
MACSLIALRDDSAQGKQLEHFSTCLLADMDKARKVGLHSTLQSQWETIHTYTAQMQQQVANTQAATMTHLAICN